MIIIIDSREQKPYTFSAGIETVTRKLPAGDYSIEHHESNFAIERKSMDDWISTIIHNQDRFRKELDILSSYDRAYIVVEASVSDILNGLYASRAHPDSILSITLAILNEYRIPIITAGDRPAARAVVERLCVEYARKHHVDDCEA